MSLINKMLQDLDARRVQPGTGGDGAWTGVGLPDRRASRAMVAMLALAAVLLLATAGVLAWRYLRAAGPEPAAAPSVKFVNAGNAPATAVPAAAVPATSAAAPAAQKRPAPVQEPVVAMPAPMPAAAVEEPIVTEPPAAAAKPARTAAPARQQPAPPPAVPGVPLEEGAPAFVADRQPAVQGRVVTSGQRAEGDYRRATAALQEGRVSEAIRYLEAALETDPLHDAARQTLVGLLLESKRANDAMRVLRSGLAADPREPAMAMLLARLEIENGGTGIDTLTRSLPHAQGDASYRAFLAGALQRSERHAEAAEQYRAALRLMPGNGVWWMGLGISLQAGKRDAEAADAYSHALSSGTLSPELRSFTERRLEQLR